MGSSHKPNSSYGTPRDQRAPPYSPYYYPPSSLPYSQPGNFQPSGFVPMNPDGYYPSAYAQPGFHPHMSGENPGFDYAQSPGNQLVVAHGRESKREGDQRRGHKSSGHRAKSGHGNAPNPGDRRRTHEASRSHRAESTDAGVPSQVYSRQGQHDAADRSRETLTVTTRLERIGGKHESNDRLGPALHNSASRTSRNRHNGSHKPRQVSPDPPVAPSAPRQRPLTPPTFSEDENEGALHRHSDYAFCACPNCVSTSRGESSQDKMARQLTEAKYYIARDRGSGRSGRPSRH